MRDRKKKEASGLGEMKLWVSYTAEHVLPLETYSPLLGELARAAGRTPYRASAIAVLEALPHVDLGSVARPLVQIFAHLGEIRPLLRVLYAQDIAKCQDLNTLFRSQSLASKMLFELMKIYGHQYLLTTVKPVIDKIYADRKSCEIDPSRLMPGDSLEKNTELLHSYFSLCFNRVTESSARCPHQLRLVFSDLRKVVAEETGRLEIERLALSSFLIMRFFAAAILNPKSFGIKRDQPESRVSRTLVLLSKILQRLANECVATHPLSSKEPWLEPILKRVTDDEHRNTMSRFLDKVSLQNSDPNAVSAESSPVLKDGYLVETKGRGGRRWNLMQNQKKRFVVLTESELCWQKGRRGGILDPKGSLTLSDIDRVTAGDRAIFHVKAEEQDIAFEAASPVEMNEWVLAIERQRSRSRRIGARHDLSELIDADVERELEGVHVLLVEHADTMLAWRNSLDLPTTADTVALPAAIEIDAADNEQRTELAKTLDNLLAVTYAIETAHREAVSKYMTHIRHGSGTRENPIGDENYLLLKRKHTLE